MIISTDGGKAYDNIQHPFMMQNSQKIGVEQIYVNIIKAIYNQSILKEISPGCFLEGMMLKLKLQYFGHLMWRVDSLEKTDAGRDLGQEEKGTTEDEMAGWHHRLDGCEFEWTPGVGDGHGDATMVAKSRTRLSDWTELNWTERTYKKSREMILKNLFIGQQWRNRHRKQTYRHGQRGGEGEMYGKSNMETYLPFVK